MVIKNTTNYEGVLIASRWDKEGRITGVSLHTLREDEFIVEMNGVGKSLLIFCQSKIRIRGLLSEENIITPMSYKMI